MTLAAIPTIEWLATQLETSTSNVETGLWVALMAGMLFATVHFIIMMVTRWGDSDPTRKALMFSVLLHLSLAFGAVAVSPPAPIFDSAEEEEKTIVREVRIENEEHVQLKQKGNTRIWEKPPEAPDQQIARTDRAPLDFKPLEGPERKPGPLTMPDLELPDMTKNPEVPVARPEVQQFAERDSNPVESAAPLLVTEETTEARPDVNVPTQSPVRRRIQRSGLLPDLTVERRPTRGSVDQISPQFDSRREVASLDVPVDPSSFLRRANPTDEIIRRTGPTPAELPSEEAGVVADTVTPDSTSGAVGKPKFTRLRTRTPRMEALGGAQRLKPELTPKTTNPLPDPVVSVRRGINSRFPVDGPRPSAITPNFDPINPSASIAIPPTYRLRNLAKRADIARKFGGTDASEKAVEASLRWLALHQNPAGYWDPDGFHAQCPPGDQCRGRGGLLDLNLQATDLQHAAMIKTQTGAKADSGVTGLVILTFLGAGHTHEDGPYSDQVDRALSWLIRQQESNGFLGGAASRYARMYCHAIATYALAEALGMQTDRTNDRRLREPIQKAVQYIIDNQNPTDGGWRYEKGQRSDMSMFGWQLMALKSSQIAGVEVPEEVTLKMIDFLKERSLGERGGLAAYRLVEPPYEPLPPSPAMTAEALFCKQMLGLARENPQSQEALEFLMKRLPDRRSEDLYYWYYGTLAVYQYGGLEWQRWNTALRDWLVTDQRTSGHAAGSWDPKPPWGPYGGRVFSTALSTLSLEVYYRFLPLYQVRRGMNFDDE